MPPFARMIAARHFRGRRTGDIEFAELSQLAFIGLLEAIDHYDPAVGVPFRRYAGRRISGAMLDGLGQDERGAPADLHPQPNARRTRAFRCVRSTPARSPGPKPWRR